MQTIYLGYCKKRPVGFCYLYQVTIFVVLFSGQHLLVCTQRGTTTMKIKVKSVCLSMITFLKVLFSNSFVYCLPSVTETLNVNEGECRF